MEKVSFGKKLRLNRQSITPIADSALAGVNAGVDNNEYTIMEPDTGGGFWSLWNCPRPGQSEIYQCNTNATCANTGCGTCPSVCTCGGGCV